MFAGTAITLLFFTVFVITLGPEESHGSVDWKALGRVAGLISIALFGVLIISRPFLSLSAIRLVRIEADRIVLKGVCDEFAAAVASANANDPDRGRDDMEPPGTREQVIAIRPKGTETPVLGFQHKDL
jgi:hypothetical protein